MHPRRLGRAWYHWYTEDDTPEERNLIIKLDLLIIPYAALAYWIKFIDQSNITNAYVSGLSDDLNFHGDELVNLQAMYTVGAVVGQIPFTLLFPMFKMNYIIPGLEIGWGIFTLLQYRTQSYAELMAYRLLVGLFEAAFFPGVHYVLGSWYRGDEIGRRGGIFYLGQMLGTLTAGLIQSGTSANLDGVKGLAGWRWMFIITAVITIPVGIAGIFIWPGTPARPNTLFLSEEEMALATKRLVAYRTDTSAEKKRTRMQLLRSIATSKEFYILTLWSVLFWNSSATTQGGYLLWIKSLKRYSTAKVNQLGSTAAAAGIFYVLFINFGSDLFLGRTGAIALAQAFNFSAMVILAIWNVPDAAKWIAFNLVFFQGAMSSVLMGWANDILRHDSEKRSIILTFINLFGQSTTAWTPLLVFKTTEGPRWLKGWSYTGTSAFLLVVYTWAVIRTMYRRQESIIADELQLEASANEAPVEKADSKTQNTATIFTNSVA